MCVVLGLSVVGLSGCKLDVFVHNTTLPVGEGRINFLNPNDVMGFDLPVMIGEVVPIIGQEFAIGDWENEDFHPITIDMLKFDSEFFDAYGIAIKIGQTTVVFTYLGQSFNVRMNIVDESFGDISPGYGDPVLLG